MNINILSNLVITKVSFVATLYTPKNEKIKRTNRRRWAIILKHEGETVYTANGKEFLSDLEHVVVLPSGSSYDWQCTKEGHFSFVEFESEGSFCEPISVPVKNGEKIFRMIKELEYKRTLKDPMIEIESIRDTYSILLMLTQAARDPYLPTEKQKKIAPAIEYIHQNYAKAITNDTLAEITGCSTVYFRKLFTSLMGISPIAYARNLRIEKATEMLGGDYGTLSDIATSLGYPSLYDFSRDFKKHTGVAPSKYEAHKI